MGLDLTLMPLRDARELAGTVLGYDRMQFDRQYAIFAQIADVDGKSAVPDEGVEAIVRTHPLPPSVKVGIYGDEGIKTTRENPYGEEMVYALAKELGALRLPENATQKNRAIMAYINALEKDTPVILEWR